MTDYIAVVTSGWHIKESVQVSFQPGNGLLHFKDCVRAALGSAAQEQVGPTSLESSARQEVLRKRNRRCQMSGMPSNSRPT